MPPQGLPTLPARRARVMLATLAGSGMWRPAVGHCHSFAAQTRRGRGRTAGDSEVGMRRSECAWISWKPPTCGRPPTGIVQIQECCWRFLRRQRERKAATIPSTVTTLPGIISRSSGGWGECHLHRGDNSMKDLGGPHLIAIRSVVFVQSAVPGCCRKLVAAARRRCKVHIYASAVRYA